VLEQERERLVDQFYVKACMWVGCCVYLRGKMKEFVTHVGSKRNRDWSFWVRLRTSVMSINLFRLRQNLQKRDWTLYQI